MSVTTPLSQRSQPKTWAFQRPKPSSTEASPLPCAHSPVSLAMGWVGIGVAAIQLAGCGSPLPLAADAALEPRPVASVQQDHETAASPTAATASAASAAATPAPPPEATAWSERRLPPRDDPHSYAGREDTLRLAQELAARHGLDAEWVASTLSQARLKESVQRLMMPAPSAAAKNWAAYRGRFIEPRRIKAGTQFWQQHRADLLRAQAEHGVPAAIIAGVIGVETLYGRDAGRYRVLDALTTLSLDFPQGRSDRSAFFKRELGEFLLMCQEQGVEPTSVLGSYAGAMGWPQFMPSSVRKFAVDFDGNGRVDLVNSPVDAIGSVARFLAAHGWQQDWPTHFEVRPPGEGPGLDTLLAPDIRPTFTAAQMEGLGASLAPAAHGHPGLLALVLLHNAGRPPTLIAGTQNFYAITRYNQSSYYALAVIQLGEAVSREASGDRIRP